MSPPTNQTAQELRPAAPFSAPPSSDKPSEAPWSLPPADRLEEARAAVTAAAGERDGIGTLRERSLHAVLKRWIEPDAARHEVKLGRYVADVFDGERVVEIQTGNLYTLPPKLEAFLAHWPVTVVYPLTRRKLLHWVEPETGEISAPRRSPRTGRLSDALPGLWALGEWLHHPGLTVAVVLLDMEEYRLRDGWSRDGKKGSHRTERVPLAVGECAVLTGPDDLRRLLPAGLIPATPHGVAQEYPGTFTTRDFARASRLGSRKTGQAVSLLYKCGIIIREGKERGAYCYRLSQEESGGGEITDVWE